MAFRITFLQKLLSYLVPVTVLKTQSTFNSSLEVAVESGTLVLNAAHSNYSYGSLFKVFKKAFNVFEIDVLKPRTVIMLGMGAGSVVKYIAQKNPSAAIDAVEIDENVIAIAEQVFEIGMFSSIHIIHSDAQVFLNDCDKKYELILIDLFIDNAVPLFCNDENFAIQLKKITAKGGIVLFNASMSIPTETNYPYQYIKKHFKNTSIKVIQGNLVLFASD